MTVISSFLIANSLLAQWVSVENKQTNELLTGEDTQSSEL